MVNAIVQQSDFEARLFPYERETSNVIDRHVGMLGRQRLPLVPRRRNAIEATA